MAPVFFVQLAKTSEFIHRIQKTHSSASESHIRVFDLNPLPHNMDLEDENSEFDPELMLSQVLENPGVSQILIRHRTATEETLSFHVRCHFDAGQQRFTLHVPFYPHFSSIPEVAAAIFDDTVGRTRITDRQKFGTRIEITLDQPAGSIRQVLIEVTATASILGLDPNQPKV